MDAATIFRYPPFNEFFDTDKLIGYFNEFANGGINHMEIEIQKGMWVPVALMSWHPMVEGDHPVHFPDPKRVAYISDSITCLGYQKKGVQKQLFAYTLEDMKNRNFPRFTFAPVVNPLCTISQEKWALSRFLILLRLLALCG